MAISRLRIFLKKDLSGNKNLRALCLTSNPYKVQEYKAALTDTFGVRVSSFNAPVRLDISSIAHRSGLIVDDTSNPAILNVLAHTDPSPHFILQETTRLTHAIHQVEILSDNAKSFQMAPVINHAYLQVWKPYWDSNGTLERVTYARFDHGIKGFIDYQRESKEDGRGFGWDRVFVNAATGRTHAEDISGWGKVSARQLVLDDFITSYLLYRTPQDLKYFPLSPKEAIDFDVSVSEFIRGNPHLSNPHIAEWGMDNVLANLVNRGLFFKAAISRPLKNYFSPPFSGIPLTAKKTGPEETVFMVHDINHHNVPDLIYDGVNTKEHEHVYAAWRMLSEAMTMIMADMLYADTLVKSGVNPEHVDTRIYPLFLALKLPEMTAENRLSIVRQLFLANARYALLGDDSLFRAMLKEGEEAKLTAFKNHFSKFFIGDHAWTHANYHNMAKLDSHYRDWTQRVGREQFAKSDVVLLSDMVERMRQRGCDLARFEDVVVHAFDEIFETRIKPVFQPPVVISDEERASRAFYRYIIGQTSFYSKYMSLPGITERGVALIHRIKRTKHFDPVTRQSIRDQFKQDVYYAWGQRVITTAMVANICQVHPIFPPVYISYDRPEYGSIQEAQQKLYPQQVKSALEIQPDQSLATTKPNPFVRVIDGVTFIDAIALEKAISPEIPAKDRLRAKMILAGVAFWDDEKTMVKTPVVGISSVGGFSVCITEDLPKDTLYLSAGKSKLGPIKPSEIADALRDSMGVQSFHTNMNPKAKTARELYDLTVKLGHFSVAHGAFLGMYVLGISKQAEHELDVQRDVVHLARETTARTAAQDSPTMFALTQEGANVSRKIRANTAALLAEFKASGSNLDWREERNALFASSACVSLGINGTVRNFAKLVSDLTSTGKELEYRNLLVFIHNSLKGLLPEMFRPSQALVTNQEANKEDKQSNNNTQQSSALAPAVVVGLFAASAMLKDRKPKQAFMLLGAPGIGKSTQVERVMKELPGVMTVSTGNLARQLLKKVEEKQSLNEIEAKAAESIGNMKQGKLMDDYAIYALLISHLSPGGAGHEEYMKCDTIILDGVIKSEGNIKAFNAAFNSFNAQKNMPPMSLVRVINIDASPEELMLRHDERVAKAQAEGVPQRADDEIEAYRRRVTDYTASMKGALEYYKANTDFVNVDSTISKDVTTRSIVEAIKMEKPALSCVR